MKKYDFKRIDWKVDKVLVCPKCSELLYRIDIEHFKHCPYCNKNIVLNVEIEDYLLKPTVDKWITIQHFASGSFLSSGLIGLESEAGQSFL
ncbi:MAG TPA: hypothetical protein DD381_07250 [Lentisphaeria bacterium]|nr:MAG: hypothetical protein A2X47_05680 [Lentisphaerae bacterium GWF2_38_69]HBM16118.1 hypothetical protein [Lentisphaeria bacterium]